MMIILGFLGFFCLGCIFTILVNKIMTKMADNEIIAKVNGFYSKLLENIYSNKTIFVNRINNTVSIETLIDGEGKLNIMYMMDKKDIAIFRNDKCIYTSDLVNVDTLDEIVTMIDIYHKDKIMDIVNVMGFTFSREDFEKKFNIKVEDLKKSMYGGPMEMSDIDNIINENDSKFDIDYILDRINKVGIDNLTNDEKQFLKNYNS